MLLWDMQQEIYNHVNKGIKMQTQTQDLEPIRKALQDRVILAVSKETGINRVTLGGIKNGKITKVSKSTYKMLAQYFGVTNDQ